VTASDSEGHTMNARFVKKVSQNLGLVGALALSTTLNAAVLSGRGLPSGGFLGMTTANTMVVNPDGVGHVLLVPYYSAQNGNATILSITNVDPQIAKAVKVRFRSALNGDTVFDLTVFLSPNDVWNGVVTQDAATGLAQFSSADKTCTLPALSPGVNYPFNTARINAKLSAADKANQTREGNIEVITMADIPPQFAQGTLYNAVFQTNGQPGNCASPAITATLVDAPSESVAAGMGFATPTSGLEGSWTLINVPQTLTFSGNATAVQAIDGSTGQAGRANYVLFPQTSALVGNADGMTADPLLRSDPLATKTAVSVATAYVPATGTLPILNAQMFDFPDLSTPYLAGMTVPMLQVSELGKALAARALANDYATDPAVNAATDWVFSFPTKRYNLGWDYRQATPARVYSFGVGRGNAEFFYSGASTDLSPLLPRFFDREGGSKAAGSIVGSPGPNFLFAGVVTLASFGALSVVASSASTESATSKSLANGWGNVYMNNGGAGLPVIGMSLIRASNPAAGPGVSGNYGITSGHRFTR
jgi:hypothetical protein